MSLKKRIEQVDAKKRAFYVASANVACAIDTLIECHLIVNTSVHLTKLLEEYKITREQWFKSVEELNS